MTFCFVWYCARLVFLNVKLYAEAGRSCLLLSLLLCRSIPHLVCVFDTGKHCIVIDNGAAVDAPVAPALCCMHCTHVCPVQGQVLLQHSATQAAQWLGRIILVAT